MITEIIKRDGRKTQFDQTKIVDAIEKAFQASGAMQDRNVPLRAFRILLSRS